MKTYTIRDNQIIINPGTPREKNITEAAEECKYCIYIPKTCRNNDGIGQFCDWFTVTKDHEYVE